MAILSDKPWQSQTYSILGSHGQPVLEAGSIQVQLVQAEDVGMLEMSQQLHLPKGPQRQHGMGKDAFHLKRWGRGSGADG